MTALPSEAAIKIDAPSEEQRKEMYSFYVAIYESSFALSKKRSVMTAVLDFQRWSWRVVGISEEAIKLIALEDYKKPVGKLARDHSIPRSVTYSSIFQDSLLEFDAWWALVWENDQTVLVTHEQHRMGDRGRIFDIDWQLGYFESGGLAGWKHTKRREGRFIEELVERHAIKIYS